jgi:ABC-type dipeptide/oligopeptide/nickel transport system permease component
VLVVLVNFSAELIYGWLDPRLRPQQRVEVT